ncbi:endonuclease/exonuclease/phosphatase family protein [Streptomyces olivaceus]
MNLEYDGGPDTGGRPPQRWHQAHELIRSRRPDLLLRQEVTYSHDSHHRRLHAAERALGMRGFLGTAGLGRNPTGMFVREETFEVHEHVTHPVHPWRTPPTHSVLRLRDAPEVDIIALSWHFAFNSPRGRERETDEVLAYADKTNQGAAFIGGDCNEPPNPEGETVPPPDRLGHGDRPAAHDPPHPTRPGHRPAHRLHLPRRHPHDRRTARPRPARCPRPQPAGRSRRHRRPRETAAGGSPPHRPDLPGSAARRCRRRRHRRRHHRHQRPPRSRSRAFPPPHGRSPPPDRQLPSIPSGARTERSPVTPPLAPAPPPTGTARRLRPATSARTTRHRTYQGHRAEFHDTQPDTGYVGLPAPPPSQGRACPYRLHRSCPAPPSPAPTRRPQSGVRPCGPTSPCSRCTGSSRAAP